MMLTKLKYKQAIYFLSPSKTSWFCVHVSYNIKMYAEMCNITELYLMSPATRYEVIETLTSAVV